MVFQTIGNYGRNREELKDRQFRREVFHLQPVAGGVP
jgi:hypothetical protein